MTRPRAAYYLRRLARLVPENRRELHRAARMDQGRMRDYADEPLRVAWLDVRTAGQHLGDMIRHPDLVEIGDVTFWLGSAATWLVAAAILAMVDTDSIADEAQSAHTEWP